jgi:glycosyltransferase involved in cell wall biosynthesis
MSSNTPIQLTARRQFNTAPQVTQVPQKKVVVIANTTWNIHNFRLDLLKRLKQKGYQVVVLAPVDEYVTYLNELKFATHVPLRSLNRKGTNPFNDFTLFREFKEHFQREKPDLIINYTIKPNIFGNLAAAMQGIPSVCVVTGLGYSFIHNGWMRKLTNALYRLSFKHAKAVLFENNDDRNLFVEQKLSNPERSFAVNGCGVDTNYFKPRQPKRHSKHPVFTFIGRLLYDKGVVEFVDAAKIVKKRHPDAEFWILGGLDEDNPAAVSEELLTTWIKSNVIKYMGNVADVRPYIADSNIVVLPSYREGMPRAVLEALSMGKPVITTQTAGCRDTVKEGRNGYLVPIQNTNDLADAMKICCTLPPIDLEIMGQLSRQRAVNEFDTEVVNSHIISIIEQVVYEDKLV